MSRLENLNKIVSPYRERIQEYTEILEEHFKENLVGILIFGSVARGEARITPGYESDIDLLVVLEKLPERFSIERMELKLKIKPVYSLEAKWVTMQELEQYLAAKTGFILDAIDEGIILYDPQNYLAVKRDEILFQLKQKGVVKNPLIGWIFPVKIGERIDYS
ncbi:MAG: nucleotidyltransferase domain-containing protein [Elusimicrobiota bacterium]